MRRLPIVLVAALAALTLGATIAAARPTESGPGTMAPDFACAPRSVCVFENDNLTRPYPHGSLATDEFNGAWMTFASVGEGDPNPGSLDDNSDSVMWIYAKDVNTYECLTPGDAVLNHSFGYFFIQFGVTSCASQHPDGP